MVFASIRRLVGDPSAVARHISGLAACLGLSFCLGLVPLQAAPAIPPQAGYISEIAGPQALRAVLSTALPADLRTFGVVRDDLERFYAQRDFAPLFITDSGWRPDTIPTLALMQAAGAHGLKPANYWDDGLTDLAGPAEPGRMVHQDLMLTAATLRYASDIYNGRFAKSPKQDPACLLAGFDDGSEDLPAFLAALAPNKPEYRGLQAVLTDMRQGSTLPLPGIGEGPLLSLGTRDPTVVQLRLHLAATGDLQLDSQHDGGSTGVEADRFDAALDTAVRAYQARHGLVVDGIIGRKSKARMNASPEDRLGLVLANFERLRWEERLISHKHVRVNIANFHLVAREGEEDRLSMPVVVGRNSRHTPVISDQIVSLKFSPDWTVPRSILEKDYLSSLRADPGFAIAEGFEVYKDGALISPYRVQWHDPRISRKVTLRKPPSSYGPLGGVRFSLTNDMAIFLHDTPSTNLFDLSQRAHSSGCVRVAEPEALAAYLLEGTNWHDQRISRAMLAGSIQIAKPVAPVQVFLSYMTAFVDADGRLQVVSDPYQLDEDLISRLM